MKRLGTRFIQPPDILNQPPGLTQFISLCTLSSSPSNHLLQQPSTILRHLQFPIFAHFLISEFFSQSEVRIRYLAIASSFLVFFRISAIFSHQASLAFFKVEDFVEIVMEEFDESINNQIAALLRVIGLTQNFHDDAVPSKIEEGLFLGSIGAANNTESLKSLNITHILTVANSLRPADTSDFVCKAIPVMDKEDVDLAKHFEECFSFIDEARNQGGGVLVHCFVGRSRSVTVTVAYLMKKHGMRFVQAMDLVREKRPQAGPNSGFIRQLMEYEKTLEPAQCCAN